MSIRKLRKVLFFILISISFASYSQTDTVKTTLVINSDTTVNNLVNNDTIIINSGALTINGNFVNHGVIINNDSLIVKGNWNDSTPGVLNIGGTVIFNGAGTQQLNIQGSDIFKNVTVSGGTITLNGKAVIQNQLNLQTIIQTAAVDTLLLDSAATIINASSTSYIDGALFRRERDNSYATDTAFFPVGDATNYRPVTLNNFVSAVGAKKAIIRITALANLPAGATPPHGSFLYSARYWKVVLVSGTYSSSSTATLYFNSSDVGGASPSSLFVTEANSSSGTFFWLGSSASTSNSVTSKIPVTYIPGPPAPGSIVYLALAGNSPVCSFSYTKTADTTVCGSSFTGTLQVNYASGADSISWMGGAYTNIPTYSLAGLTSSTAVYFTLKSTTAPNCFQSDTIHITINAANPAWSVQDSNMCMSDNSIQLIPVQPGGVFTGTGVSQSSGNWYFNPNSTGAGAFKITYTVCSAKASHTITVSPGPCENTIISNNGGGSLVATPQGVFTTCDGTVYYSNYTSGSIYKVDSHGNITMLANAADGLNGPQGLTVNESTGDVYFCDAGNNQIKKIDGTTGAITVIAGSGAPTSSATPTTSDNTNGLAATFTSPGGVVIDYAGQYLYVSDSKGYRIARVSLSGTDTVITYAGMGINNPAVPGDTLPTPRLQQKFGVTGQLAIDQFNNLYVPDEKIRAVKIVKATVDSVETLVTYKQGLTLPIAVAVNGDGDVYIADNFNCTIYDYTGGQLTTIIGNPDSCGSSNPNYLSYPSGVSFNAKGYLDIADTDNDAIKRFTLKPWSAFINFDGTYCITSPKDTLTPKYPGGRYIASPVSASVTNVAGQWYFDPKVAGVGTQKIGYVYTMENCTDTLFTNAVVRPLPKPNIGTDTTLCSYQLGVFQLNAGGPYASYKWYDDNALIANDSTQYYTVTDTGTFFVIVTDTSKAKCVGYSDTVQVKSQAVPTVTLTQPIPANLCAGDTTSIILTPQVPFGTIVSVLWQDSTISPSYEAKGSGKYIAIATVQLGSIECISTDTTTIQYKLDPQVSIVSSPTPTTCNTYVSSADSILKPAGGVVPSLKGIAKDSQGNFYVTDVANNVIWKIPPGGSPYIYAGKLGVASSTGTDTSNATFSTPYGIAVDNYSGDIYVSEQGTSIIRKITFAGKVSKFAGVIGSSGYNGAGFKDTTEFNSPAGITITPAGGLYVADMGNNLVRKITPTGIVNDVGTTADYSSPNVLTAMKDGSLLVGNSTGVILKVSPLNGDSVTTYSTAVTGSTITGMATDNSGRLYVTNSSSFIVNEINTDGTVSVEAGSGSAGYQNGLGSSAQFLQLGGMYMAGKGLPLYVTDGNFVRKIVDSCSVSICDSITLTASPATFGSYAWTSGATTVSSASSIKVPAGIYALTVIGSNGCPGTDTLPVKQLTKPAAFNSASSQCIGYSGVIGPVSQPNFIYLWTDGKTGGTPIGLSSDSIAQPTAIPSQQVSVYVLTITDTLTKCMNRDTISFIVTIPAVYAGPDTNFCQGGSVQIGDTNTATVNTILAWSPSTGLSNTSIPTPTVSGNFKVGTYMYILTAKYTSPITHTTCTYSDTMNLTVDSVPTANFTSSALCIPDTAFFKDSSTTQDPIISRIWVFGDGATVTATGADTSHYYSTTPTSPIQLTVTTSKGCSNTKTVLASSLNFYPKPSPNISYTNACVGLTTKLSDASTVSSGTITSWDWNINNGALIANQTQDTSILYTYSGGTTFSVNLAIQSAVGCKADTTIQVNLHNTPTATISPAKSCTADTTAFTSSAVGTDLRYKWYFGDGGTSSQVNPKYTYTSPGTYQASLVVTDTSAFCSDSVSENIVIIPAPIAAFTESTVCSGDTIGFINQSSPSSGLTYLWNFGDATSSTSQNASHKFSSTGPYNVQLTVTDPSTGCNNTAIDTLALNSAPNPAVVSNTVTSCKGDTTTLTWQNQVGGVTLTWKDNGQLIASNVDSVKLTLSGTYTLVVTGSNGCADSSITPLHFLVPPDTVEINIPPDTSVCIGDTIKLTGSSNGDSLTFLWSSNGAGVLGNSSTISANYTPESPDSNFVIVTFNSSNKCASNHASTKIYINQLPNPLFTLSPSSASIDVPVTFVNTTDTALYHVKYFKWNFGDYAGDTSNLFTPSPHAYADSGHYAVALQATNSLGCKNTYIVQVVVINSHIVYIPNIFTPTKPTANPENKVCKVYGVGITTSGFSYNIYDRWGGLVFSTTDFTLANTIGWDGKNHNAGDIMAQMGVYTYVVKGNFQDGTSFEKVGTVTLAQ